MPGPDGVRARSEGWDLVEESGQAEGVEGLGVGDGLVGSGSLPGTRAPSGQDGCPSRGLGESEVGPGESFVETVQDRSGDRAGQPVGDAGRGAEDGPGRGPTLRGSMVMVPSGSRR